MLYSAGDRLYVPILEAGLQGQLKDTLNVLLFSTSLPEFQDLIASLLLNFFLVIHFGAGSMQFL